VRKIRNIWVVVLAVVICFGTAWAQEEPGKKEEKRDFFVLQVKKGWTLSKIAGSFNTTYQKLAETNGIENPNLIYVGQELKIPVQGNVNVSWYGPKFHGRPMANGKKFDMNDATVVAHRFLPFGTKVRLTRLDNGKSVEVIVQDRGPYIKGRQFDLSFGAAKLLEMVDEGVVECKMEILPEKDSKNKEGADKNNIKNSAVE